MCIAILNKSGLLSKDTMENCYENNPDGMGMLWSEDGKLRVYKRLKKFGRFYSYYEKIRNKYPDIPIVLHFRIGTSGLNDIENCHPFLCNDNIGFVHNGILGIKEKTKKVSDTYTFNQLVLKGLPDNFIHNVGIRFLIEEAVGTGNKLIFLDSKNGWWIANEDEGHWDNHEENWFSNYGYSYSSNGYSEGCYYGDLGYYDRSGSWHYYREERRSPATYPAVGDEDNKPYVYDRRYPNNLWAKDFKMYWNTDTGLCWKINDQYNTKDDKHLYIRHPLADMTKSQVGETLAKYTAYGRKDESTQKLTEALGDSYKLMKRCRECGTALVDNTEEETELCYECQGIYLDEGDKYIRDKNEEARLQAINDMMTQAKTEAIKNDAEARKNARMKLEETGADDWCEECGSVLLPDEYRLCSDCTEIMGYQSECSECGEPLKYVEEMESGICLDCQNEADDDEEEDDTLQKDLKLIAGGSK